MITIMLTTKVYTITTERMLMQDRTNIPGMVVGALEVYSVMAGSLM